jgi:site-specific recombinase
MGFTPIVGEFFGLPLEVRHVTLAAAQIGFSLSALLGPGFPYLDAALALLGLGVILLLNLGVSLGLAFTLACRAREVRSRSVWLLARSTLRELKRRPLFFLFPPRRQAAVS